LIALLLALVQLTDTAQLNDAARLNNVPPVVMQAVAWMESRDGRRGNEYRGPGREQCDSAGCRRVCREIGRMQINPCIQWSIPVCNGVDIRRYFGNIRCGAAILAARRVKYGSWESAIRHYNGSGPLAERYLQTALAYIGRRTLTEVER